MPLAAMAIRRRRPPTDQTLRLFHAAGASLAMRIDPGWMIFESDPVRRQPLAHGRDLRHVGADAAGLHRRAARRLQALKPRPSRRPVPAPPLMMLVDQFARHGCPAPRINARRRSLRMPSMRSPRSRSRILQTLSPDGLRRGHLARRRRAMPP